MSFDKRKLLVSKWVYVVCGLKLPLLGKKCCCCFSSALTILCDTYVYIQVSGSRKAGRAGVVTDCACYCTCAYVEYFRYRFTTDTTRDAITPRRTYV